MWRGRHNLPLPLLVAPCQDKPAKTWQPRRWVVPIGIDNGFTDEAMTELKRAGREWADRGSCAPQRDLKSHLGLCDA